MHGKLILGDHMQLRPHVLNHELSVENRRREFKYNLDMSLFERLCSSGVRSTSNDNLEFPMAKLTVQRRMRPQIADLIRIPLYPGLQNHPNVQNYPQVQGMYHEIFWFDHAHREDGYGPFDMKETSHSNVFEVEMVKQLVSHLSKQGYYKDGELAVITPYVGQLRKLRDALRSTFSVQLSEKDEEEVEALEQSEDTQEPHRGVEHRPLTQSVRIATVSPSPSAI
jgi:superfamily I DNA and/or RNA helicase